MATLKASVQKEHEEASWQEKEDKEQSGESATWTELECSDHSNKRRRTKFFLMSILSLKMRPVKILLKDSWRSLLAEEEKVSSSSV